MGKVYPLLQKVPSALFCILLTALAVTSCMEKDVYKGGEENEEGIPNSFDYLTKSSVTINLDYGTAYDVSFEMYYSNPISLDANKSYVKDADMKPFITGKTDAQGRFKITFFDMPNTEKDLYVYSPNLTVPILLHGTVNGNEVAISAKASRVTEFTQKPATRASSTGDYYEKWEPQKITYSKFTDYDQTGIPAMLNKGTNIEQYKLQLTDKFKRTIQGTLETNVPSYSKYLSHEYISISEKANVYINFVSHHSKRNNALAYYTLDFGESAPELSSPPTNLTIAFPNLNAGLNGGDVLQLQYYDKKSGTYTSTFPANCRIGFVLLVDAFQGEKLSENSVNLMYSDKKYNLYNITTGQGSIGGDRPQMFAFMADEKLVLSFEDMPWHENNQTGVGHGDFSDDIFTITTNPITALPDDVKPGTDSDDATEETPDGGISTTGILAFEDNWPNKGDYDMNDVMFSYQRTFYYKMEGYNYRLVSIDEIYCFLNDGASFNNGFGYEIGAQVKRDDVEVTVTSSKQCNGQGLDADSKMEKATVMLVDNANNVSPGTMFTVKTKFKSGTKYYYPDLSSAPYNPFIVVTQGGSDYLASDRVEVHLPRNYKPTPKADLSLFHTGNDLSEGNIYYVTNDNYPFALEITGAYGSQDIPNFVVPTEREPIDKTYPKFNDWVAKPDKNANWWKEPK